MIRMRQKCTKSRVTNRCRLRKHDRSLSSAASFFVRNEISLHARTRQVGGSVESHYRKTDIPPPRRVQESSSLKVGSAARPYTGCCWAVSAEAAQARQGRTGYRPCVPVTPVVDGPLRSSGRLRPRTIICPSLHQPGKEVGESFILSLAFGRCRDRTFAIRCLFTIL